MQSREILPLYGDIVRVIVGFVLVDEATEIG